MKVLFLSVNSRCDMACKYCFYTIGHEKRLGGRIEPKQAKAFAEAIKANGFTSVILTGGDPFYSKYKNETFELIKELKEIGLRVLVNTSGAGLNARDLNRIVALNIDRVDISINSLDAETHNQERGHFEDAIGTITGLVARGYARKLSTTTVVTPENAKLAAKTIEFLQHLGVEDTRYQPVFLKTDQDYAPLEQALDECAAVCHKPHTDNYLEQCKRAYNGEKSLANSVCQMGRSYFVSDCYGNLTPCFHRGDIILGNMFLNSPEEIDDHIASSVPCASTHPRCFGKHCVSLYDNPLYWKEKKSWKQRLFPTSSSVLQKD